MTREEAARVIESHAKHGVGTGLFGLPEAFTMAIAALRGPQPDPTTGLVPCGCGDMAMLLRCGFGWHDFCYECIACGTTTRNFETEAQAKTAWNHAMGMPEVEG